MSAKSYTLDPSEKATQVMMGTPDMLLWGDLVTKEHVTITGFLNTLAEDFVPVQDAKLLLLAPAQQAAPLERSVLYVKLEEILLFFPMGEQSPLPEESEVRRYEPIEAIVGPFQVQGEILKSPIASLQNLLLVSKEAYMPIYRATVRHVGKPWLGTFSSNMVQVRHGSLDHRPSLRLRLSTSKFFSIIRGRGVGGRHSRPPTPPPPLVFE